MTVPDATRSRRTAGKFTLIADDLPPDQRITGNAQVTSVQSLSIIIGPSLARAPACRRHRRRRARAKVFWIDFAPTPCPTGNGSVSF